MALFKVRFINSSGFVASSINWVTNSLFDHTEIEVDNGYIGAHDSGGVQLRPLNYCQPSFEKRYAVPCTDAQYKAIMQYAQSQIGTPYNFKDIAGLLLRRRALTSPSRLICSQFVFRAALAGRLEMLNVLPEFSHLVTPETLHLSPLLIGHCTYSSGK
jgi:uncharacterized protein YycO